MSSSNPFRKKGGAQPEPWLPPIDPIDNTATTTTLIASSSSPSSQPPPPPPTTTFRSSGHDDAEQPPAPAERKPKVVKKVRVLSPPPLSPDLPGWQQHQDTDVIATAQIPDQLLSSYSSSSSSSDDPFDNGTKAPDESSERDSVAHTPPSQPSDGGGDFGQPPANPFSKTLHDLENARKNEHLKEDLKEERREEGAALKAANVARGSLDVDAFKRLLMTGHTGEGQVSTQSIAAERARDISRDIEATRPAAAPEGNEADGAAVEEELSDSGVSAQIGTRKKAPPPPPSSRHGKSIKTTTEAKESPDAVQEVAQQRAPSDSKPLPPEPTLAGSVERETEPGIPRDTKGDKIGESESATTGTGGKKPVPAPPPRRGHARMESKAGAHSVSAPKDDEAPPRSSAESVPTRSNSVRHGAPVPAPPPPRRPQSSHRPASLQPSPTSATFHISPNPTHTSHHHPDSMISTPTREISAPMELTSAPSLPSPPTQGKVSAPPPPPARNSSVRRPPSVHSSTDPPSRHASGETKNRDSMLPPPPPPSRRRGNSKSSVEGSSQRTSLDGVSGRAPSQTIAPKEPVEPGHGDAILADLDALKREVEALRGNF